MDNALSVLSDPKVKKQIEIEIENARKGSKQGKVMAYAFSGNDDGKGCGSSYSFTNNQFDEMFAEMEDDGLINRNKGFSIKKRNGELSINGKKQPGSVLRKYDSYLGDAKEVSINGSKGNMSISIEK